jgi:hypothetical protein
LGAKVKETSLLCSTLLQWLVSLLSGLQEHTEQQHQQQQQASVQGAQQVQQQQEQEPQQQPQQQEQQQDAPAPGAASTPQLQAARDVLSSLLAESGVAAAAASSAGQLHAQGLVDTARAFHQLALQLQPSPEQLLCFRERVCLPQLLPLPADDARLQVLTADVEVRGLVGCRTIKL